MKTNKVVAIEHKMKSSLGSRVFDIFNVLLMCTMMLLILIPLLHVLSASFSSSDAISMGKVYLWPVEFSMEGYKMLVQNSQILNGFKNSIIYMGLGVLLNMSLTMLLAFPLSRKELPGRNLITVFVAVTMYVSGGLIPTFLLVSKLELVDTLWD